MDELQVHRTITYLILLLAALSSTTLGLAVKRQSGSGCLFQYVLQPPKDNFNTCNPFEPAESSLTLKCSILVWDNRPGELTIDWIYTSTGRDRTETLLSNTTATSPGTIVNSTITISNTIAGHYHCQPNSTQAGLLRRSSQTTILSRPLYVNIDNSCEGIPLSTKKEECILEGNFSSDTIPIELSNSETSTEQPTDTHKNYNILYKSLGGVGLLIVAIVVCMGLIACCYHHKRTSRSRVPKSEGRGSRVVREWHAVRTTQTSPQSQNDRVTRQYVPPPHTLPPVLASVSVERDSRITSSGYVDANPLLAEHGAPYQDYSSITRQTNRDDQSEWSQPRAQKLAKTTLPSSYTNTDHQYINCRQPHANVLLEPIYEDGTANATPQLKERPRSQGSLEEYSEVGNEVHLYQGLVPETIDYISLYHTVKN